MNRYWGWLVCSLWLSGWLTLPCAALDNSAGEMGINARRLQAAPYNLTGRKIAIGQLEIGRPGKL